jgi:hypothetical protein
MKKKLYLLSTILLSAAVLSLSSCLKDSRYVDFSKVGTIVDFPLGGKGNFGPDAITDATDTIVRQFAISIASQNPTTTATNVVLAVDNSIVTSYNAADATVVYSPFPTGSYVFTATSVTIPAGKSTAIVSVTFYKNQLDPSKSYMLPIKIVSASGLTVSGNMNIHYYHIIGNDFAGTYVWDYYRYNSDHVLASPSPGTTLGQVGQISPVTPTEFQMITGYNGQGVHYDVKFTRTVSGGTVSYSDFAVTFVADDVTNLWGPLGITVIQPPVILPATDPTIKRFDLQYIDFNGTADRYIIDSYHK